MDYDIFIDDWLGDRIICCREGKTNDLLVIMNVNVGSVGG